MRTDDLDAVKSKLYEESEPFLAVHQNYNLKLLPSWVAENIEVARVYGNSKKGVILPDGRKYHLDNHINDMTGKEWTFFINSVFSTRYPTSGKEAYAHHIRKIHPTPKPPQLMRDLIQFFTKEGELVFDPFMGVGGTLLGSALCNRISAGIDLNQNYIDAYYKAALDLSLQGFPTECGDCLSILKDRSKMGSLTTGKPISLLLFDPPYIYMCYIGAQPTQIVILKILLVCSPLFAQVVVHYLWAREQEFLRASPIKEIWVFYFCNLFHFCISNLRSYIFNKMMKMH